VHTLAAAGRAAGFAVTVVEKVAVGGLVASSTKVRELVLEGRVDGAGRLLGRPVELAGEVVRGDGRGRSIGIPTANLGKASELVPAEGVYAGTLAVLPDGTRRGAAINVGKNPTFHEHPEGRALSIEAHVLDWTGDLYGRRVRLEFLTRLRGEQKFETVEALVAQIRRDLDGTRAMLRKGSEHGAG
jgi:riboflavin kinase/FMN adenylyltransferase